MSFSLQSAFDHRTKVVAAAPDISIALNEAAIVGV
jgi:hypothetical protein